MGLRLLLITRLKGHAELRSVYARCYNWIGAGNTRGNSRGAFVSGGAGVLLLLGSSGVR